VPFASLLSSSSGRGLPAAGVVVDEQPMMRVDGGSGGRYVSNLLVPHHGDGVWPRDTFLTTGVPHGHVQSVCNQHINAC
jgi:hypothetical protein